MEAWDGELGTVLVADSLAADGEVTAAATVTQGFLLTLWGVVDLCLQHGLTSCDWVFWSSLLSMLILTSTSIACWGVMDLLSSSSSLCTSASCVFAFSVHLSGWLINFGACFLDRFLCCLHSFCLGCCGQLLSMTMGSKITSIRSSLTLTADVSCNNEH